jgi:hypothetical protein
MLKSELNIRFYLMILENCKDRLLEAKKKDIISFTVQKEYLAFLNSSLDNLVNSAKEIERNIGLIFDISCSKDDLVTIVITVRRVSHSKWGDYEGFNRAFYIPKLGKIKDSEVNRTAMSYEMQLTPEMVEYAASKFVKREHISSIFETFKNHYIGTGELKADWQAVWKKWISKNANNNSLKQHMPTDFLLDSAMLSIAENLGLDNKSIDGQFKLFKNYYISEGSESSSWRAKWENWCIRYIEFKKDNPKQSKFREEKQQYSWNFAEAEKQSDFIKLELYKRGIDWAEYYFEGKNLPDGILWQDMPHPITKKEVTLLYLANSKDSENINKYIEAKIDE